MPCDSHFSPQPCKQQLEPHSVFLKETDSFRARMTTQNQGVVAGTPQVYCSAREMQAAETKMPTGATAVHSLLQVLSLDIL